MIELKQPLLWDGRMVPAGTKIALPPALERLVIAAGNGEEIETDQEAVTASDVQTEKTDSEQGQEDSKDGAPPADDPELKLGRTGSAQ